MSAVKIYVVTMHRWGDDDSHNYVQGAFTRKAQATKAGEAEACYRGGKYAYKVVEVCLDAHDKDSMEYLKTYGVVEK